jgi:hypothetical protein
MTIRVGQPILAAAAFQAASSPFLYNSPFVLWGRLSTCGRLAIGLLRAIENLPGIGVSRKRPITNRPQVNNLPHNQRDWHLSLSTYNFAGATRRSNDL